MAAVESRVAAECRPPHAIPATNCHSTRNADEGPGRNRPGPSSEDCVDQAVRSTASISSSTVILSPTTTPPPSIGMSMSTP